MDQAKKAAARSWRSTLSSGGEGLEREPESKDRGPPEPSRPAADKKVVRRDPSGPENIASVQQKALQARYALVCTTGKRIVPLYA